MIPTYIVTGGAGFIGSSFVRGAVLGGRARVVTLDKLTYAGNVQNLRAVEGDPNHVFVHGDICDKGLLQRLLAEHRPTAIVHFAAESHVDRSIDGPRDFIETNLVGTFELLEAARHFRSSLVADTAARFRFLHVSTDEVFGSLGEAGAFSEISRYAPNSPYAATKAGSDHLVRAYHHTYGLPVVTTNCSNNFGPFQFPEKLIPLMVLNALEGKPLPVYGDGQNVRDWLFVEDHCEAIHAAIDRGVPGETYLIGGHNERKNIDLVHTLCALLDELAPPRDSRALERAGRKLGSYRELVTFVTDRPGHDRRYAIDASKVRRELGWAPRHTFEEGMKRTIEWYLGNRAWCDAITSGTYRRERLGLSSPARAGAGAT
jgi:dTDP-glucose 4,6-dehydratase